MRHLGAAEAMPIVVDDDGPDERLDRAFPTRPLNEKEGGASGGRRRGDGNNPAAKRPKLDAAKDCDVNSLSDDTTMKWIGAWFQHGFVTCVR